MSQGADGVQALIDGQLNLEEHGVRLQSVDGFHRTVLPVGVSHHGHVRTTLLHDVTHQLTPVVSTIDHHDSDIATQGNAWVRRDCRCSWGSHWNRRSAPVAGGRGRPLWMTLPPYTSLARSAANGRAEGGKGGKESGIGKLRATRTRSVCRAAAPRRTPDTTPSRAGTPRWGRRQVGADTDHTIGARTDFRLS